MTKPALSRLFKASMLFGLGVATGLVAQTQGDLTSRVEYKRADLTGAPNMEVIVSTTELKPGEVLPVHAHHGLEATYVIQGATVQMPGKDPITLASGANLLTLRDVKHGGFKNISDASLKLFAVHIVDKSKPLYEFAN